MSVPNFTNFPSEVSGALLSGSNGLRFDVVTGTPDKIVGSINENILKFDNNNVIASGSLNTLNRNIWNTPQCSKISSLGSAGSSLAIDLSLSNDFSFVLNAALTLQAPSNPIAGQSGVIIITQSLSSAYSITYNSFWKFSTEVDKTVSATLGSTNILTYYVISPSMAVCNMIRNIQ